MEDEDLLYGDLNEEALKAPVIEENTNEATEAQYLASENVDSLNLSRLTTHLFL